MASNPNKKHESSASTCTTEVSSISSAPPSPANTNNTQQPTNNAPKYGTLVPNRIFVGGISGNTTETELAQLFSAYGNVKATKVISDRAGVSKGYGFVTFETEEEAKRLMRESECIVLKERKLNIAPAIKKQPFSRSYEVTSPPATSNNAAVYYQNGMPYTFHNGMAYFGPTSPPHPSATTSMGGNGDPNALYSAAYVPPSAAAGPTAAAAATYPVIYPCAAQPVFMSQQFPFQPLPPPTQNSQYLYTGTSSPTNGASGAGAPPPGTPITSLAHHQHFYSPSALNPSDMYYSVAPMATGQTYGTLVTSSPDGILYETLPASVEASNGFSAEENSSNSSRPDLQRSGGDLKSGQDAHSSNSVANPDAVNSESGSSGTQAAPAVPAVQQNVTDMPPVVSLLKLQQQGEEAAAAAAAAAGGELQAQQQAHSASVPYTMTPSPVLSASSVQPYSSGGQGSSSPVMPVMYHHMLPVGNPSLGSPLYMNQQMGYSQFVPPMYGDQIQHVMMNGNVPSPGRLEKRNPNMPAHLSKNHFVNNNNPMALDNNDRTVAAYQKRQFIRNGPGSFMRDGVRFNPGGRFVANAPCGSPRHPFGRFPAPNNVMGRRRNAAGNNTLSPAGRSSPSAQFAPLNCHIPDMHNSVSPQFHPGVRQMYYQPCSSNSSNTSINTSNNGNGSGVSASGTANGPHAPRRHGNNRKSSNLNSNRSGASGNGGTGGKYSRAGANNVQAMNSAKGAAGMDKGGAGDASSMMPITPPSTPHVTENSNVAIQETCREMQALAL